ncbi:MAG TPA: baseplate J/gp47 family protein, partial [Flavisolibacter sp.]|nr:baseplate J/gp47 family protein [Flavisolibacter sp.]
LANQPSFAVTPSFNHEGELMLGLDKAVVDTTVAVLFQVSEGSANPLKSKQEVVWQYLAKNNVWKDFENGKVSEDTNGLLHSGIVSFALPADLAPAPSLMGGSLRWIRAFVQQSSDAICNLVDLKPQAIKAVWTNVHHPTLSYTQKTPAGTITKLQQASASVKKIDQPYDSFGGRFAETEEKFYLRSSERLRHKRRAITIWDYEHLVLEAFPEIYKVKCLNHTKVRMDAAGNETGDNELAPGCVVVVPLPDLSQMHSRNPLRPLTSLDTLSNIEVYLKKITSGFVRIQSRNPVFEEIVIRCDVQFFGNDPGYYHDRLQEDLQRFLCPWAYDPTQEVEFGGKISKSILI